MTEFKDYDIDLDPVIINRRIKHLQDIDPSLDIRSIVDNIRYEKDIDPSEVYGAGENDPIARANKFYKRSLMISKNQYEHLSALAIEEQCQQQDEEYEEYLYKKENG
tara:strand:+ start:620 stop:940 length:321 start_codon:yes stop_codon:yes gene_type:complete